MPALGALRTAGTARTSLTAQRRSARGRQTPVWGGGGRRDNDDDEKDGGSEENVEEEISGAGQRVSNVENLPPHVIRQVWKEVTELAREPPEGIKVYLNEDDITDVQATIEGPEGTPYAGGIFRMKLVLGKDFPASPPKAYFLTKIFHPNVSSSGEICVNVLKKDWKAELGIRHVLLTVKCLLIHPNPESALNEEAGRLLLEAYEDYAAHAKLLTEIHALPANAAPTNAGPAADGPSAKKHAADKDKKLAAKKKTDKKRALKRL
ncbi:unnamed protein product [Lampetra planeri]